MIKPVPVLVFLVWCAPLLPAGEPIRLTVVGDIMVHGEQLAFALNEETGRFDFDPSFEMIRPRLTGSDQVIGNLETTLAGPGGALRRYADQYVAGFQGYPLFNTPDALIPALKQAGFTILTTANNHSFDSGPDGIDRTLTVLDNHALAHTGTGTPSPRPLAFTCRGLRFVLVSYTWGTNINRGSGYDSVRINSLENYRRDRVETLYREIRSLRVSGQYDIIIVSIHFGDEYRYRPGAVQKELVDTLFASGADVILGSHPHVLQPVEIRTIKNEDGSERTGVVAWSLGNFISSRRHDGDYPWFCDTGVVMTLLFGTSGADKGRLTGIELVPVWTQWTGRTIRVIPAGEALTDSGREQFRLSETDLKRLNEASLHAMSLLGLYLPCRETSPGVWYHDREVSREDSAD